MSNPPECVSDRVRRPMHPRLLGWFGLAVGFALLFGLSASRSIQWQDSGHFVLRVVTGSLNNELGLALVHPLQYWMTVAAGWLSPLPMPWTAALLSALFGAVTVANVFGIVHTLTRHAPAALLAAASLGIAHTFWRQSAIPEAYTITTALLSAELWCLILLVRTGQPGWAIAMMAFNGLGWSNHNLALLSLPVIGLFLLWACWQRGARPGLLLLLGAAALWLLGAAPYWGLIVLEATRTGEWMATMYSALFGQRYADDVLNLVPPLPFLAATLAFTALSFPHLFLPVALYGLIRARTAGLERALHIGLAAVLVVHLLFVLRYSVIDQYTFMLPSYTIAAIFAGLGFALIARQCTRPQARAVLGTTIVLLALTPPLYLATPEIARQANALGAFERNKPYRDDYRYLFWPWVAHDRSAERMSTHALELAGQDGLIISPDNMASFALHYQRWRLDRPQVRIVREPDPDKIQQARQHTQPVVLVPRSTTDEPPQHAIGQWQRDGDLYRLVNDHDQHEHRSSDQPQDPAD